MSTRYIGQVADFEIEVNGDTLRIWDSGSEITVRGEGVSDGDDENIRHNLKFQTIEVTGDDDKNLTNAWKAIEAEIREYYENVDVEIVA